MTIVEKIFSNHACKNVFAGDMVMVEVDASMVQDMNGPETIKKFESFASTVLSPERHLFSLDHFSPCSTIVAANNHAKTRKFCKTHSIDHFVDECNGVCHTRMVESGLAKPGSIIVGTDSHCCHYGALNAFATGVGASEEAIVLASNKCWFKIPESIKIELVGKPKENVSGKDVILHIISLLRQDGAIYKCIEFVGEALSYFSMDSRQTICNMAVEAGAKSAIMPFDSILEEYLTERGIDTSGFVVADSDANYYKCLTIDVSNITPLVAIPPEIDNVVSIKSLPKTFVNEVVIGGCTNGRFEDFNSAAQILRGKKIHPNVRLLIVPSSVEVAERMRKEKITDVFLSSGATVLPPCCGPCAGISMGLLGDGEVCFSTSNRNGKGRMGSKEAYVYIGSPISAAYTSINGYISCGEDR